MTEVELLEDQDLARALKASIETMLEAGNSCYMLCFLGFPKYLKQL